MNISTFNFDDVFDPWDSITVRYQSPPLKNPKDADLILIGEEHGRRYVRKDHSALIRETVTPGSVLLMEGLPALIQATNKEKKDVFKMLLIEDENTQKKLTVFGWDTLTHLQEKTSLVYLCKNNSDGSSDIHVSLPYLLGEQVSMLSALEKLEKSDPSSPSTEEALTGIRVAMNEEIKKTFSQRTQAMCHTIKEMARRKKEGEIQGKIYVVAGADHVVENRSDFRFSLDPLFDTIKAFPAIVTTSRSVYQPRSVWEDLADSLPDCP